MTKKINFSGQLKLSGNINRILEMSNGGLGDNAISGHFKDKKINVSPQFVREIRIGALEASKKALPKKVAKQAILAVNKDNKTHGTEPLPA
jgi:hypothetical protein